MTIIESSWQHQEKAQGMLKVCPKECKEMIKEHILKLKEATKRQDTIGILTYIKAIDSDSYWIKIK